MEHAKRLYLVDEFDRVYKQLQRPAAAVAKTHSSIQLSKTLDDSELTDDEKVRRYVAELHRYLNVADPRSQQQQQQQPQPQREQQSRKRKRNPININTESLPPPPPVPQIPSPVQWRQLRSDTQQPLSDNVFTSPTQTVKKKTTPKVKSTKAKSPAIARAAKKRRKMEWSKF